MNSPRVKTNRSGVAVDPVCGMSVEPENSLGIEHDGRAYHFCSERCRERFEREPERFIGEDARKAMTSRGPDRNAKHSKVAAEGASHQVRPKEKEASGRRWTAYLPLLIVIGSAAAAALAKQVSYAGPASGMAWMHDFMGFFLVIFAMFKFFDLRGFSDGFRMYDLLAKRAPGYAYVYPLIELGLGLGYLTQQRLPALYALTVVVMVFGALGVIGALRKGLNVNCACMGTVLKVPLSTVALTENLGMAAMAAVMWMRVV